MTTKEERKKIERSVMKYVKSLEVKDKDGKVIDSGLKVHHHALLDFYKQPFFLALASDDERLHAKQVFKDQLPFKEYLEERQKDPDGMLPDIEDFEEMYNPKYKRITTRRNS